MKKVKEALCISPKSQTTTLSILAKVRGFNRVIFTKNKKLKSFHTHGLWPFLRTLELGWKEDRERSTVHLSKRTSSLKVKVT